MEVTIKPIPTGFYIEGLDFTKEQTYQSVEEATIAATQRHNAMKNNPNYWSK
jgi:hypothetical protein